MKPNHKRYTLTLMLLIDDVSYYDCNGELVFVYNKIRGREMTTKQIIRQLLVTGEIDE